MSDENSKEKMKQKLMETLEIIEKTIYNIETDYLTDNKSFGNLLKGWETCFNQKNLKNGSSINCYNNLNFAEEERQFSLSSLTSQVNFNLIQIKDKHLGNIYLEKSTQNSFIKKRLAKKSIKEKSRKNSYQKNLDGKQNSRNEEINKKNLIYKKKKKNSISEKKKKKLLKPTNKYKNKKLKY